MPVELTALALALLLQGLQFVLFALPANLELGTKYTTGPRDAPHKPLSLKTARLQRAMNNHFEALILFAPAALVVAVTNQSSPVTQICAGLYLGARILYIPAYVFALVPLRSAIWCIGFFATMVMVVATLI
ncbi:MAPEG family protein [Neogemmobacter tilapiae]|uniref:Membrane protein n=1 Tax=Neogemmobacter tilapiae TaxID=875041 RepID=A0A918TMP7_9RHOB|nr:MAPEG family protein [Gemmobacter tilapiae]GHC52956.1 membrane protein [Gemmobacter tilapiae]